MKNRINKFVKVNFGEVVGLCRRWCTALGSLLRLLVVRSRRVRFYSGPADKMSESPRLHNVDQINLELQNCNHVLHSLRDLLDRSLVSN